MSPEGRRSHRRFETKRLSHSSWLPLSIRRSPDKEVGRARSNLPPQLGTAIAFTAPRAERRGHRLLFTHIHAHTHTERPDVAGLIATSHLRQVHSRHQNSTRSL
ncbi:hypothetical protein VTN49DRAFT_2245 [Thermomyces lanuginosus]|uniref:uncharacterized protein n=1 Tax=Thermomyces lanuginosus TaxID=5541 RepID=UPI003742FBEA